MAFYYAKEKREFDREWEKLRSEYTTAGMSGEDIDKLYAFDWDWFCSRRRFINHTQGLPAENIEGEDSAEQSSLIRKFPSFSISLDETLITIEGYNQTETARLLGCSQKNISLKMTRIKKVLKNI